MKKVVHWFKRKIVSKSNFHRQGHWNGYLKIQVLWEALKGRPVQLEVPLLSMVQKMQKKLFLLEPEYKDLSFCFEVGTLSDSCASNLDKVSIHRASLTTHIWFQLFFRPKMQAQNDTNLGMIVEWRCGMVQNVYWDELHAVLVWRPCRRPLPIPLVFQLKWKVLAVSGIIFFFHLLFVPLSNFFWKRLEGLSSTHVSLWWFVKCTLY